MYINGLNDFPKALTPQNISTTIKVIVQDFQQIMNIARVLFNQLMNTTILDIE